MGRDLWGGVSQGLTVLISLRVAADAGAAGSGWSARSVARTYDLEAAVVLPEDDCQREELSAGKRAQQEILLSRICSFRSSQR
jgi:hypothetical protein